MTDKTLREQTLEEATAEALNSYGYRGPGGRPLAAHDVAAIQIVVKLGRLMATPDKNEPEASNKVVSLPVGGVARDSTWHYQAVTGNRGLLIFTIKGNREFSEAHMLTLLDQSHLKSLKDKVPFIPGKAVRNYSESRNETTYTWRVVERSF
jgi:hypothetical protein